MFAHHIGNQLVVFLLVDATLNQYRRYSMNEVPAGLLIRLGCNQLE
jgi:hypothetical protein